MPVGAGTSKRTRIYPSSMRSGRSSQRFLTLALVLIGLVLGLGTTMCIQSLNGLPSTTTERSVNPRSAKIHCAPTNRKILERSVSMMGAPHTSSILPWPSLAPKHSRNLILVGVMTAQKYVDSRAWVVWRTWAQTLPGKVLFFVAENTRSKHPELPLIRLPGVDDTYPPQKKSFMMLRWMHDHALEDFEWFVRADDDVYIRGDKLEMFLRSLNSSVPLYLGQAGLGTPEEYGQLSLGQNENYCMGGPGVIFSRETLRKLRPHIPECLSNMYTTHEDVEIGRCVRKHVGTPCSWSYEMQTIFYNNQSGSSAYSGDLNVAEVHQAITLHPVKKPVTMKRLHNFARKLKTSDLRFRSLQLSRDVYASLKELLRLQRVQSTAQLQNLSDFGHPPSLLRFIPDREKEMLSWDFLSPTILYCSGVVNCPRHNAPSFLRYALSDTMRQAVDVMNRYARQRGRILVFQDILYAYRRVDPLHGADYIVDMLLLYRKFKGRQVTVPVRRHAYLQQSFANLEIIETGSWRRIQNELFAIKQINEAKRLANLNDAVLSDGADDSSAYSGGSGIQSQLLTQPHWNAPDLQNDRIHLILPLAGRVEPFRRFLRHYEQVCLRRAEIAGPMELIVVLFPLGFESESDMIRSSIGSLRLRYPDEPIRWIEVTDHEFSRGLALSRGAESVTDDSLLFFTDVDILFDEYALYRIRQNTVRGVQVNFPIVFSEYAPEASSEESSLDAPPAEYAKYDKRRGYFRHFGYGIASLYRRDLDKAGGLETGIKGWGLEDVNLFEKCFKKGNFTVFRAPDPNLVHVYHPVICDRSNLPDDHGQFSMCLGSRAQSFASIESLADRVYSDRRFSHLIRRKGA